MAFSAPPGPPASPRRIEELAQRLESLGLGTFREARHQLGLNQRQSKGKFTEDEVDRLLASLEDADSRDAAIASVKPEGLSDLKAGRQHAAAQAVVATMSDELLADELIRRGWCCIAPPAGVRP